MTKYSILVNQKGTILSFHVENPDTDRFPSEDLTGHNFGRLVGFNCWQDLDTLRKRVSKSRRPASFSTFVDLRNSGVHPIIDWTIRSGGRTGLFTQTYQMYGVGNGQSV
jgi:hypothetical protein